MNTTNCKDGKYVIHFTCTVTSTCTITFVITLKCVIICTRVEPQLSKHQIDAQLKYSSVCFIRVVEQCSVYKCMEV